MPLYEYQCEACGHRFEVIQKFSDAPLETCPKCGGTVRKLQSAPAIQFKGAGWYITDYAKKDSVSAGKTGESSTAANAGTASGDAKGGDSKSPDSGGAASGTPAAPSSPASAPSGPAKSGD